MAQAFNAAVDAVGPPPAFNPLALFMRHLDLEYGGFRRDQMHHIRDFRREKDDTPSTMYTRLARLSADTGNVFTNQQLVEIFLANLDKKVQDPMRWHLIFRYHVRRL